MKMKLSINDVDNVTVAEDLAVGTVLSTVIATTDADNGLDGSVRYEIVSGAGPHFDLAYDTGIVTVVTSLDRETALTHVVIIRAVDAGTTPNAKASPPRCRFQ